MKELIEKITGDPILMLSGAVAIVVLIFVLLVVVIASMRIKVYKDRYVNTKIDNEEKEKRIAHLEQELHTLQMTNARNEQSLEAFSDTKVRLTDTESELQHTKEVLSELQSLQARTQANLESAEQRYEALAKVHDEVRSQLESVSEENNKLRVNNARLLMKLEAEERAASQMKQQRDTSDKSERDRS